VHSGTADTPLQVMRKRKFFASALVVAISIAAAVLILRQTPGTTPVVSLGLIGYSNMITYPNGTRWIQACVGLTNTGSVRLSYGDWDSVPRHWIKAETATRPRRYGLSPGPRVGNGVLLPGSNEVFWLIIPADTVRWKYGLSVRVASTGERLAGGVISAATRSWIYPLCRKLLGLLPHKSEPEKEFESEWLDVPNALQPNGGREQRSTTP